VLTGEDGSYRIESAGAGRGILQVTAEGWFQPDYPAQEWQILQSGNLPESLAVEVVEGKAAEKDLVLKPAGTVEGTVVDGAGAPVPGIPVHFSSKSGKGGGGSQGLSDAEGKFRAVGVAPGEDLVGNATGPGGTRGASDPFRLDEGGTATGVRVAMKAGATVAGRIRREDGGTLTGAVLRLIPGKRNPGQDYNWDYQRRSAPVQTVAADGAFRAEGVFPGTYTLRAESDGTADSEATVVEVKEGEVKEGVEVVLPEEKVIRGKVRDAAGAPVAGALISVTSAAARNQQMYYPGNPQATVATTDAEGAFSLRGLGKGTWSVTARFEGLVPSTEKAEAGQDVSLVLTAGLSIEGVVVDETTGAPVEGMNVSANDTKPRTAGGYVQPHMATTKKDGTFALTGLAEGTFNVVASLTWNESRINYQQKSVNGVAAGTKDLRVQVAPGVSITGTVKDEAGKPAGGANVQAMAKDEKGNPDWSRQRYAQVQADGAFRLAGLAPGVYDLTVQSWGGGGQGVAPTTVRGVAAGTEGLAIVVRQGLTISGRVVDEKGGAPGQQGNIQITPTDAAGSNPGADTAWAWFGDDGNFTSQPLDPARTYDVSVRPNGGGVGTTVKAVVPGTKDLVLTLRAGASLAGRVVDPDGQGVKGVPVFARAEGKDGSSPGGQVHAVSGENGEFTLKGLGEFSFKVTAGGGQSPWRPSTADGLHAPGATGVTVRLQPGVALSGRLVDRHGNGVKSQWIMATNPDGGASAYTQVAEDGTFTLKGLAEGKVALKAIVDNKWVDVGTHEAPGTNVLVTVPD
jgi:protocatechuate 3,4-dioxygenase beta subunit